MNIQQFEYILAVVDSNNFEEAAEKCSISQSTLSTMIGRFEAEIGIKIFNRKSKPVTLTKEGNAIVQRLRIIDSEIGHLKNTFQELKGEMKGELRIGVIPTIAPYLLPLFLQKFAQKFPGIEIIVQEIPTHQIVEDLKKRSLDVGILALPIGDPELKEQELYVEPFLVYDCRENNVQSDIHVENLDFENLWLLKEGHCLRTQVYHICEQSSNSVRNNLNFVFESGSMDSLLRFAKSNKGMTIIPHLATMDFSKIEQASIKHFAGLVPSRSVGLITHQFFVKKKLVLELSKIIRDAVKGYIPYQDKTEIVKPL